MYCSDVNKSTKIIPLLSFRIIPSLILGWTEQHLTDHIYTLQAMVLKTARNSLAVQFLTENNAGRQVPVFIKEGGANPHSTEGCFTAYFYCCSPGAVTRMTWGA